MSEQTGRTVRVKVPATSANLGPGFDSLGLALALHDEVTVTLLDSGNSKAEITGEGADAIPRDETNLVARGVAAVFDAAGMSSPAVHIQASNQVPFGRGLGSSASAIVAGVVAGAELVASEAAISREEQLRLATDLEGHPDNVAAALFGGLTIAWQSNAGVRCTSLSVHPQIAPLVLVPETTSLTAHLRELTPATVPHADAVFNSARAALLVAALTQDPSLLLDATADRIHQNYRASAMPETAELVARLRADGYAAVVSGAGPSVLVLAADEQQRLAAVEFVETVRGAQWQPKLLSVDAQGGRVIS